MTQETKYPAEYICHWPSGSVPCCERHARELRGMANFLGAHVAVTKADEGQTCTNCENELAAAQAQVGAAGNE